MKDNFMVIPVAVCAAVLFFLLGFISARDSGRESREGALNDCLIFASTHSAEKGAQIRDACIAVYVGNTK